MNTNAITVIYSDGHPLAKTLESMDHTYLYEDNFDFTRLRKNSFIIDLTILNDSEKEAWLQEVTARYPVISDTSCNWGEYLQTRFYATDGYQYSRVIYGNVYALFLHWRQIIAIGC